MKLWCFTGHGLYGGGVRRRRDGPWLASAVLEDVISWSKIQMTRGTWNVSARSIDRFEQFSVFVYGLCCSLHRVDIKEGSSKQFPTWILNFWPCGQYFNYAKVCYFWWLFSFFYGHSSHCGFLTEKFFFSLKYSFLGQNRLTLGFLDVSVRA